MPRSSKYERDRSAWRGVQIRVPNKLHVEATAALNEDRVTWQDVMIAGLLAYLDGEWEMPSPSEMTQVLDQYRTNKEKAIA